MWNAIWSFFEPFLVDLLVAVIIAGIGILGTELRKYLKQLQDYTKAKLGSNIYNDACLIAKGLYYVLEIEFSNVAKSGESKRAEMISRLKERFTSLTDTELSAINEAICAEVKNTELAAGLVDKTTTTTTVSTIINNDQETDKTTKVVATSTSTVTGATLDVAEVKVVEPSSPAISIPNIINVTPPVVDMTKTTGVEACPKIT